MPRQVLQSLSLQPRRLFTCTSQGWYNLDSLRVYSTSDYSKGISLVLVSAAVAVLGAFKLEETGVRNIFAENRNAYSKEGMLQEQDGNQD